jgi:hypothetical protein
VNPAIIYLVNTILLCQINNNNLRFNMKASILLLTSTFLLIATPVFSKEYPGGARVIEVDDGIPKITFNPKLHSVSLFLEAIKLDKESGWFTQEKEFALTVDVTVESKIKGRGTPDVYETSRVFKIPVSQYKDGALAIPLKGLRVVQGYDLSGKTPDNAQYVVRYINVAPKICRKVGQTVFSKTLNAIFELSNNLPIPNNPYTEAGKEVGAAIKNITTAQIQDSLEASGFGEFGTDFMPVSTDNGGSKIRKTGATALIFGMAKEPNDKGRLDVNNLLNNIKYNDKLTQLEVDGIPVSNDYLVFRTQANTDDFADPVEAVKSLSEKMNEFIKAGQNNNIDTTPLEKAAPLVDRYKDNAGNFKLKKAELAILKDATESTENIQGVKIGGGVDSLNFQ